MRRERSKTHAAHSQPRPSRRIHEESHDVYGMRGKLTDPAVCPGCGALYQGGRWTSTNQVPEGAKSAMCAACRRIEDDYPAGILTIEGEFTTVHREEIEHLVRNVEERERSEHPLVRIFAVEKTPSGLRVPTTDARLARSIGQALAHAYHGELQDPGPQSEEPVRVHWSRN